MVQRAECCSLLVDNHSGAEHLVHVNRNTFEVTEAGDRPITVSMKDTVVMLRLSMAEIDLVADDPGATFFHGRHAGPIRYA